MEEKKCIRQGKRLDLDLSIKNTEEYNRITESKVYLICGLVAFKVQIIVLKSPSVQGQYKFDIYVNIRFIKILKSDNLTYTATILYSEVNDSDKKISMKKISFSRRTSWTQLCYFNYGQHRATPNIPIKMTVVLNLHKCSHLAFLHNDTIMDLTDFELCCKDGSVHVHKAIIAGYSPVLQKLVTGDWREAKEGRVNIEGTTTIMLQHLKDYMYKDKLPENGLKELMVLASYYLMEDLVQKCSFKLLNSLSVENGLELAEFAAKYGNRYLFLAIIKTTETGVINFEEMEKQSLLKKSVDNEKKNEEDDEEDDEENYEENFGDD